MDDIKKFFVTENEMEKIIQQLEDLADASDVLGDYRVANKLSSIVKSLDKLEKDFNELFNNQLKTMSNIVSQSSATLVNGIFAGYEIGKTKSNIGGLIENNK